MVEPDDAKLLNDLVRAGLDLLGVLVGKLVSGSPQEDLTGWGEAMPLRWELQVQYLSMPCADHLQWGLLALGTRYSGVGLGVTRFLYETLGVLRWVTAPSSAEERQARSLQLMYRDVNRLKKLLTNAIATDTDSAQMIGYQQRLAKLDVAVDELLKLAPAYGLEPLTEAPWRKAMLDEVFLDEGGYSVFAGISEFSSHPGFSQYLAFANSDMVNVDLNAMHLLRAYWCTTSVNLFANIVLLISDVLDWKDWYLGEFEPRLKQVQPLREEVHRRFNKSFAKGS